MPTRLTRVQAPCRSINPVCRSIIATAVRIAAPTKLASVYVSRDGLIHPHWFAAKARRMAKAPRIEMICNIVPLPPMRTLVRPPSFTQRKLYITCVILQAVPKVVDHDERRERIAEAAWRVIEREGIEGANLRRIARETGHTTGVVTHYFRDKRELMGFAFGLVVDRSTSRMDGAAAESGATGALAQLLPLDEERRRETTVWLALMSASLADPELAAELRQRYRLAREAIVPMFWAARKKRRGDTPEDFADELLSVVDGITVDALTDPERFPPDKQLVLLRRAVARLGLSVEPPAAST